MREADRRRRQRIERLALGVLLLAVVVAIGAFADDVGAALILSGILLVWVAAEWLLWSFLLRGNGGPRRTDRSP